MSESKDQELLNELQACEDLISDRVANNMETFGVSSTVGRLLGIIYMNRQAMTLDELAAKTGMSKTRMSQVMRQMISLNIAEKEFVKGSRKEYYNVESDYVQTFISLFTTSWKEVITRNMALERRLRDKLSTIEEDIEQHASADILKKHQMMEKELDDWTNYYNWIDRLVDCFETGEIFQYVPIHPHSKEAKNDDN
ncbi:betaine operon transcriptional regulator [Bacillus sp. JCM 19047]|uniref:HTH-type transcriptional regulator n=3 Tax=Bacillaceae TaxID=186817 RepID=A0ABY7W6A0_9BACI|nr:MULTISPECIES: MarR family transcriptional regulator [Shouchella]MED4128005.1 GbsR/MarR family transcriptional regulator [Shouchella miscanthi]WDF03149.1 GbsR/MarR family transcriptional regulator [Shouchella hunanensis]GAF21378.1 betaine operon transcriptional regulator [Bacillus sp. JCM 19047]